MISERERKDPFFGEEFVTDNQWYFHSFFGVEFRKWIIGWKSIVLRGFFVFCHELLTKIGGKFDNLH